MQAKRRVFARAIAASGSSKAPGTGITVTPSRGTPQRVELGERRLEQLRRHVAVEPRDDDADGAALSDRDAPRARSSPAAPSARPARAPIESET